MWSSDTGRPYRRCAANVRPLRASVIGTVIACSAVTLVAMTIDGRFKLAIVLARLPEGAPPNATGVMRRVG